MSNLNQIMLIARLKDGSTRPATGDEIIVAARENLSPKVRRGTNLSSPRLTSDYLTLKMGALDREIFAVLFGQPPPPNRIRGNVPRHDRRRVGSPAGSRERSVETERRRGDPCTFCGATQNGRYAPPFVLWP